MKSKPILIIEDNKADQLLLSYSFRDAEVKNEIIFAYDGVEAFEMLTRQGLVPFMIIADINMPRMTGLELKKKLDARDVLKSIPFIFMTHSKKESDIREAYLLRAQGYFEKRDLAEQTLLIQLIIKYWMTAEIPKKDR